VTEFRSSRYPVVTDPVWKVTHDIGVDNLKLRVRGDDDDGDDDDDDDDGGGDDDGGNDDDDNKDYADDLHRGDTRW
jgi:hypothetical protein